MCCLYTRQLSGDIAFLFFCSGSGQRLLQLCGQTLFHFVCGSFREGHGKNGVNGDMILHDQIHQTCNQHGGLPASCGCGYQDIAFLCLNRLQLHGIPFRHLPHVLSVADRYRPLPPPAVFFLHICP